MGRKCAVEGCLSDSNRPEDTGVTFHKVPSHTDIRPKWLSLCRIPDDKKNTKVIYICSRHFLRMDFCNFKGKKYMLRQGVLPSVFPWDKSKLEAIKTSKTDDKVIKDEIKTEVTKTTESTEEIVAEPEVKQEIKEESVSVKSDDIKVESDENIKIEDIENETKEKKPTSNNRGINFAINSRIEALDFNNIWYPARIVEEDYEENEVLIHFEKFSNKYDEWICMDSPRLRPLQLSSTPTTTPSKRNQIAQYVVGERCLASWSDARKFPATVTKVLSNDSYEVVFDDGYVKILKAHRMSKSEGKPLQQAPLFDPIQTSKQERRDKKRKIDVAALFGKRPKIEHTDQKLKASGSTTSLGQQNDNEDEIFEPWVPEWDNGKPVGIESSIDTNDGMKKSIIVPDPRLPKGWVKHLTQRSYGASVGKWDTIIMSPDNRRFRSRSEVKAYLEETGLMKYNWSRFDFSIHRHRNKRRDLEDQSIDETSISEDISGTGGSSGTLAASDENSQSNDVHEDEDNSLKIPLVDGNYTCPIEGCGKIFRKENLAQMHIKHYHPEYTKYLNSTPNVADLAYARTVGESLDKSPGTIKQSITKATTTKTTTPKTHIPKQQQQSQQLLVDDIKPQSPQTIKNNKDSEIIKLLNNSNTNNSSKTFDAAVATNNKQKLEQIQPLPSGLPSNMYPDIKLKDLLNKSEGIPPKSRDDINLKALSTTRPPTGIKTLLPVVRNDKSCSGNDNESIGRTIRTGVKRKRGGFVENVESNTAIKGNELYDQQQQQQQHDIPTTYYHHHQQQQSASPSLQHFQPLPTDSNNIIIEGGQVIKIVRMKQEEIINCTCGFPEEDGLMIQCDLCLCWQHAFCNNIERESQVPEKYVCYICQNSTRQRMSKKYSHDQDWLKQGVLGTLSFHTKDDEVLARRFEKLKKSHDVTGGLLELKDYVNTLRTKMNIAESKNHPKLYLWSKSWEKLPLPEKIKTDEVNKKEEEETDEDMKPKELKSEQNESMLMMMLKGNNKDDNKNQSESSNMIRTPIIPQPEAAINSADCRLNLLEHIAHSQSLVEERLDEFEKQIEQLMDGPYEDDENYPRTRQTCNMLLKDLNTLYELSQVAPV